MNNKDAIEHLKGISSIYNSNLAHWERVAIDKAIASLEAWDKVLKELDTLDVLRYSTGERVYKDEVLDVINKYLEEVGDANNN